VGLGLVSYPLWFAWLLKPVAASRGIECGACIPKGYGWCELSDVSWSNDWVAVRAERLIVQMPHRWVWTCWTGAAPVGPQAVFSNWWVEAVSPLPLGEPSTGSTAGVLDGLQRVWPTMAPWVRSIRFSPGEVRVSGNRWPISSAACEQGALCLQIGPAVTRVDLASLSAGALSVTVSNRHGSGEAQLRRAHDRWTMDGGVTWRSNRFELRGEWDHSDWLPVQASLCSPTLRVPADLIGVTPLGEWGGSLKVVWSQRHYRLDLNLSTLTTNPVVTSAGPVRMHLAGGGDLRTLRIEQFEMHSTVGQAVLEQPIEIDYAARRCRRVVSLNLSADLARLSAAPVTGALSGAIQLDPDLLHALRGSFHLSGESLNGAGVALDRLALAGVIDWPQVECTKVSAHFAPGGVLTAQLAVDLAQRRLKELYWRLDQSSTAGSRSPCTVESIQAQGTAQGVWPDLNHTGRVEVLGLRSGPLRIASGTGTWSGRGLWLDRMQARFRSGASELEWVGQGGVEPLPGGLQVELGAEAIRWATPERVWRLKEPVRVRLQSATNLLQITLSPLTLQTIAGELSVQGAVRWPSDGSGRIQISGLRAAEFEDFLDVGWGGVGLTLTDVRGAFDWDHGPLAFEVGAQAGWVEAEGTAWSFQGRARSDGTRIDVDPLRIFLAGTPMATMNAVIPLQLKPAEGWHIPRAAAGADVRMKLEVLGRAPLWTMLERRTGLRMHAPALAVEVSGRLPDVEGRLSFRADQVALPAVSAPASVKLPELDQVRMEAGFGWDGFRTTAVSAEVLGQRLEAEGEWRVGASNWIEWVQAVWQPDWQSVRGRVWMEQANVAALAALVPGGVLAPAGALNLDLELAPGRDLRGRLTLTNSATRPLKPIGALRNLDADIQWTNSNAVIHRCAATLGGRRVGATGTVAWRSDGDYRFAIELEGGDLSLVREADLLVRGDVAVKMEKPFGEPARVSGDVQLQRSLLFRDFNTLLGFDASQAGQRPPYFSITQLPFADWQLDLHVLGDRFLRVISPAFKGEVSVGLHLLGSLREPLAVGAVTVDSGKLLFPFGTVDLEHGRVDLTREDPYRPRLDFRGVGQNYGYAITLDLRGPIEAPGLTFQSVPPLSARQILLLLTAGEIPRSDFGYSATDKAGRVGYYIGREFVNRFLGSTSTSERLTLRTGEYITDEGKPTYSLFYRLSDRWSAFGEYDRFRDFNSGLRFKVLTK
jgi:translocation and assembly module TamB